MLTLLFLVIKELLKSGMGEKTKALQLSLPHCPPVLRVGVPGAAATAWPSVLRPRGPACVVYWKGRSQLCYLQVKHGETLTR